PVTFAVRPTVWLAYSEAAAGVTVTALGGTRFTVASAVLLPSSATRVTRTVTVRPCGPTVPGAVYTPVVAFTVPVSGDGFSTWKLTFGVGVSGDTLLVVAVNCCV